MQPAKNQRDRTRRPQTYRNFRALLQEEMLERCRKNPQYSLRSFAKVLGVEPSALSQILNNKRPLTEKMKLRLGTSLGLSVDEIAKIPTAEASSQVAARAYEQQDLDTFAIISDWYHYAILELTSIEGFESNTEWISKRLGITKSESNIAVERLLRLGLLKETPQGAWVDASDNARTSHLKTGVTSSAAKKYQTQLLELSKESIQTVDIKKRNHTSATFSFDPSDMAKAIERIQEFRRSFAEEFQPKKTPKEVYQIQISFFPLTKNQPPSGES